MKEKLAGQLEALVEPFLVERGFELVDMDISRRGRKLWIRLFVDLVSGGIGVEDCADINRDFGRVLDVEDLITESYILEVSSPGLDRRIRKLKDFIRFKGQMIRVSTKEGLAGRSNFRGELSNADEDGIELKLEEGAVLIPHRMIARANLEYSF